MNASCSSVNEKLGCYTVDVQLQSCSKLIAQNPLSLRFCNSISLPPHPWRVTFYFNAHDSSLGSNLKN
ncbi:hypothetical protein L1887_40196 [Cichorium endivia]|nr:hypothetical protein L1887_40196 [Cichorium endivia]